MIETGDHAGDWPFLLDGWLAQASEIICKYRGYKSVVVERRTLLAGVLDPDAAVAMAGRKELAEPVAA